MKEKETVQAQGLMEELILSIITADGAKSKTSFKYVSPEWVGRPGWFFWPKKKTGVYYLKLKQLNRGKDEQEIIFDLYYYPHPDELEFAWFSCVEQMVRVSELFSKTGVAFTVACECQAHSEHDEFPDLKDGKGVPLPECRESLNPWLFLIGQINSVWKGKELQEWGVESQALSQTWGIADVKTKGADGQTHVILEGRSIDRDLPAWQLAEAFCEDFLEDLSIIDMVNTLKEKRMSEDPYATNRLQCFVSKRGLQRHR